MRQIVVVAVTAVALVAAWATGRGGRTGPADPSPPVPVAVMDHSAHAAGAELQDRLDGAVRGDLIALAPGTYHGNFVVHTRGITLSGGGGAVLDGMGAGSVLEVAAPDVTVRGLRVVASGTGAVGAPSGVLVSEGGDRARIVDVSVRRSYFGVVVRHAADVVIDRLDVVGAGSISGELHAVEPDTHAHTPTSGRAARADGVWLFEADGAIVRDSTLRGVRDGIYLSYGTGALLERNRISGSRYAVHDMYARDLRIVGNTLRGNLSGCVLMYGGPVVLQRNLIIESGSPSTGFGVLIKDAAGVRLERNVIAGNRIGLHVDDAGRTVGEPTSAVANTFALNQVGVVLFPSADAGFTENSFVENSSQVAIGGSGTTQAVWDLRGTGNYWSDFAGVDADGDGRGDLPYTSSGRVGRLIADDPVLAALASGPAFRFLAGVEDRWGSSAPIVHDRAPLAAPRSWTIGADDRGPGIATAIPGAVVVAIGVWSLVRARRPRVLREVA